ncbi:hypothetical protein [Mucilaginibacter antarcticus]|uniref:hypothetical protein n=1 Tax=Mucilaginibacter antarcticus TaxID=1855725 RepID=UPI00362AA540
MKHRTLYLGLMLCATQSLSAQNIKTEKGHENNPYYSNTDTKHIKVSDAEWKKY